MDDDIPFLFASRLRRLLKCLAFYKGLNFWDHKNVSVLWC